jgi:VanZ family protein
MLHMPGFGARRSTWLPFVLWLGVVFGLSSIPNLSPPDVGLPMSDKIAHLGEYAVLGALFTRARGGRRSVWLTMLVGLALGAVIGTVDESYQSRTPGREVSAFDALADTIGATLGAFVWWQIGAWRTRRSHRPDGSAR